MNVFSILISVLMFLAGVYLTNRYHTRHDKKERIETVLAAYMEFRTSNITSGLAGLQKAGVAMLRSTAEIKQVAELIIKHGELDPLQRSPFPELDHIDLRLFFNKAARERLNLHDGNAIKKLADELVPKRTRRSPFHRSTK
jgi:hypothetical protein